MKKALAVLLSVLVMFSMLGVVAFAEEAPEGSEDLVFIKFCNEDGSVFLIANYSPGTKVDMPANQTKPSTETEEYIFKGWECELDGEMYYENEPYEVPMDANPGDVIVLTAKFATQEVSTGLTFWKLVESIFARFNLIFQYFAKIFEW